MQTTLRPETQTRLLRILPVTLLAAVLALQTGCRSLPRELDPGEISTVFEPAPAGPLADFSRNCREGFAEDESCFLLLARNDEDLYWRLALIDSAQESLDLQTFIWARDFSGRLLIHRMLLAA